MKNLIKRILSRIIILFIIVIIPILTYFFIDDDVQITWNINQIREMNRYIITAEYSVEEEKLAVIEKIEYINNVGKDIDKLFFHINRDLKVNGQINNLSKDKVHKEKKTIYIESVKVKNRGTSFKQIGTNEDILMVKLNEKLKDKDRITIEIKYNIKITNFDFAYEEGQLKCELYNWYPLVAEYDNGWKLDSNQYNNNFDIENSYYYAEIMVPEDFKIESTGKVIKEAIKSKKNYYIVQGKGVLNIKIIRIRQNDK